MKLNLKFFSKAVFWLCILFVIVLGVRLFIAFQTPLFNYDAYYDLRQVEHIKDSGMPLYKDDLSYGGKTNLFAPLHHYILALFSLIFPINIVAKVLPNIFAAAIVFIVYYLSLKLTKNSKISLLASLMSGIIPIYFVNINKISVSYLAILLIFSIIYCMLRLNERKYVDYALILMFLLVLTTPLAFLLAIGLLIYLLLLKLENHPIEMKELEIILFFTFLVFWVNLLIYKNAFLTHGLLVIWQNIPVGILSNFFSDIGFIEVLAGIGIIPIIFGVYGYYASFHHGKDKDTLLIMSLGISVFLLLWFKLVDLINGLLFLGVTLAVLAAYSLKKIDDFIVKSKIHKHEKILQVFVVVILLITALPAIFTIVSSKDIGPYNTPEFSDVKVLQWAEGNTPKNSVIMSSVEEGNIVSYYAQRKNVMDTNFLLTPRIDQRLANIGTVYTTIFQTQAIGIMGEYKSKYLFVSESTRQYYHSGTPEYLTSDECFHLIYRSSDSSLYKLECKIS